MWSLWFPSPTEAHSCKALLEFIPFFSGLTTGTPYSLLSIYSIPTLTPPGYAIFFHLKTAVTSDPRVCLWENHLTPVA